MQQNDFNNLLERYVTGNCTAEEQLFIERWLEDHKTEPNEWTQMNETTKEEWMASLFGEVRNTIQLNNRQNNAKVLNIKRVAWLRITVAASIIGLVMLGTYVWFNRAERQVIAKAAPHEKNFRSDVLPGGDKAVLTLADGSTIALHSAQNGILALQGGTKVIKQGEKLAYHTAGAGAADVVYNTISTPRGGQYQLVLPDGSKVWLNAASSLHFPTAFAGKARTVEVKGEAYFEVAKNSAMPFIVRVGDAEVQVLGTHFNVMAYGDEEAVKTTLLEGSVQFVSGNNISLLIPGQQSQLTKTGQVKVVSGVDVNEAIAWKNGMFHFEKADIETVMRQLSRWYDVDVDFRTKKSYDPLNADIPRATKLSDALKALELSGSAKFEIEGKKVVIIQ